MTKRKFYRTVFEIEVLGDFPIDQSMSLSDITREMDSGDLCGGISTKVDNQVISGKRMAKLMIKQGSDPEFFMIDENGNEIDF